MAADVKIKLESYLDYKATDFRAALRSALDDIDPNAKIDEHAVYRSFVRAVGRRFHTWEPIPDRFVDVKKTS